LRAAPGADVDMQSRRSSRRRTERHMRTG